MDRAGEILEISSPKVCRHVSVSRFRSPKFLSRISVTNQTKQQNPLVAGGVTNHVTETWSCDTSLTNQDWGTKSRKVNDKWTVSPASMDNHIRVVIRSPPGHPSMHQVTQVPWLGGDQGALRGLPVTSIVPFPLKSTIVDIYNFVFIQFQHLYYSAESEWEKDPGSSVWTLCSNSGHCEGGGPCHATPFDTPLYWGHYATLASIMPRLLSEFDSGFKFRNMTFWQSTLQRFVKPGSFSVLLQWNLADHGSSSWTQYSLYNKTSQTWTQPLSLSYFNTSWSCPLVHFSTFRSNNPNVRIIQKSNILQS